MRRNPPAPDWRARLPFYYGWVVIGVAFLTMAVGVNARTAFSLLYPSILDEHGWDRGATAGIFANVHLGTTRGLERGFDVWFQPRRSRPLFLLAERARERLAPWLLPDAAKPYPDAHAVAGEVLRFVDNQVLEPR